MKKYSKILALVLVAVLLVGASVMGTVAYLTSRDTVTNTFTVGKVSITMDESKVNVDGIPANDQTRVQANAYKLMPGHSYTKDPIIHVSADSEACWLFVKVEDEIAAIEAADTVATQLAANGWTLIAGTTNIYGRESTAGADANVPVFGSFTIKGDVTGEDLAAYADKSITITAYAIQADGFATAAAAWAAAGQN